MKKILFYILILITLLSINTKVDAQANTQTPCAANHVRFENKCIPNSTYILLAPLPCDVATSGPGCVNGKLVTYDPTGGPDGKQNILGTYVNTMLRIFIGICAVLAMIMIILGGLEYMTSEVISSKEAGKEKITGAVLGLMLALGSWALLNTINPKLLDTGTESLKNVTVEVSIDEVNFARTEQTVASAGTTYARSGVGSTGVADFINNRLSKGENLRAIKVDTKNNRAYFYVGQPGDWSKFVSVPINVGYNGVAQSGEATAGDGKTPIGITTISSDRRISNNNTATTVANGKYNVGPAFINIGTNRGIGFHGSANNQLGTTNGCIRMKNDDLLVLAPYMRSGVQVIIE